MIDLVVITAVSIVAFLISGYFDLLEELMHFADDHEEYELDEILTVSLILSIAVAVFAVRRIQEFKHQWRKRMEAEGEIHHMAYHDALTGLPNRVSFGDHLVKELARARRAESMVAVMCLDLDRFKQVNDLFGHATGDELLRQVTKRFDDVLRDMDTLARLGGDEFAVMLPDIGLPENAAVLARRLIDVGREPFDIDGQTAAIGVSIGISVSHLDETTEAAEMLRAADMALYRAKADGRDCFHFFEPEMDERLHERMLLERDLRLALKRDELRVHFQPIYDLPNRDVVGFEALLRWRHPERGEVDPLLFVPIAEESSLILPIGEWVLRHSCQRAMAWPGNLRISVNLSAAQFQQGDLAALVGDALFQSGLAADRLELEITESILMHDTDAILATLRKIKSYGVHISMDDFGTGYSSLSYLRRFPFDKIKIDQSFVQGVRDNPDDASIVRAVLSLGRSLGMVTTAEGVETAEQLAFLLDEGCGEAQGYLFSAAVPADQTMELLHVAQPASAAAN
ncbi:MAG: EAL domain-containing protein [Rhodospirillaceae bacterium]|nr:EAL domain-containing protein [Rhodospirillaceae bacterium]